MPLSKEHKTAILIFAQTSGEEQKHKRIYKGIGLFDSLTENTLKTAAKTQLPYFHFSEEQQIGATFGERFTNAVQAVFEKGYQQIITIGNDTPQLTAAHILQANVQLQEQNFVLGPSVDGGFYLMGLHQSQFDTTTFQALAWQTSNLSKQLVGLMASNTITVFQLPVLFDIDTTKDIKSVISFVNQLPKRLFTLLCAILGIAKDAQPYKSTFYTKFLSDTHHNKGSPLVP